MKQTDTSTVVLDRPLGEAFDKVIRQNSEENTQILPRRSPKLNTELLAALSPNEIYELGFAVAYPTDPATRYSCRDLLLWLSRRAPAALRHAMTAGLVDLCSIAADTRRTLSSDLRQLVAVYRSESRLPVSVSPELIMARESVALGSLLVPSGAALIWQEVLQDSDHDGD